jgi:hypothetical protein
MVDNGGGGSGVGIVAIVVAFLIVDHVRRRALASMLYRLILLYSLGR